VARTKIALNTEPHVIEVGEDVELLFQPEVMGDVFIDAYSELREVQEAATGTDLEDLSALDPAKIRGAARAMRSFLAKLMLPESAEFFTRVDVVKGGEVLASFTNWAEAEEHAAGVKGGGARAQWAFQLPDHAIVQIMDTVVRWYGGGADQRPPTSSSGSAKPSNRAGRRGMGVSPSRVSTPASGR
jgi:hypothetical protein